MIRDRLQEQGISAADTLSQSYSDIWEAAGNIEGSSAFVRMLASNDLIFVVLGVSLIIWFVLLFFIIRVDRKVAKLEKDLNKETPPS